MRERLIAHRLLAPLVEAAVGNRRGRMAARAERPRTGGPIRIVLLTAYGMGGTIRTVFGLAAHLAQQRQVELVSLGRWREDEAFIGVPEGVHVSLLDDRRPGVPRGRVQRLLTKLPSVLMHPDDFASHNYTLWTDLRMLRRMRSWRSGVVITTRPAFSLFAGRFARPGVFVIAQEHANLSVHPEPMRREMERHYRELDMVVVLTQRDLEAYRRLLAGAATEIEHIPNAVPDLPGEPAAEREKVVLAAGRFAAVKGFDLLLEAFSTVAQRHPDWRLRIHGQGVQQRALERLIAERGLDARAELRPATARLGEVMARSAVLALSSRAEGFGMVILEAMSKGMAVVAFDCPTGPREIITDGRDGLLVPPEDVAALADALTRVIEDEPLRRRLGAAGRETARRYSLDAVGGQWEALLGRI